MKIKINGKIFNSQLYKGKTVNLFEDISTEFLKDERFDFIERLKFVYDYSLKIIDYITESKVKPLFNIEELNNDRDILEVAIEQYKLIKYLLSGDKRSYEKYLDELEQYEVFSKDKVLNILVDYKIQRFGDEIFKEMGIEIIDRIDKGFIVRDKDKNNQLIN